MTAFFYRASTLLALAHGAAAIAMSPGPSRNAQRFQSMVDAFGAHPPAAIEAVPTERKRLLCRSASAALEDPRIVDAVGILYEDLSPVRIAGDLIFRKLESAVGDAAKNVKAAPPPAGAAEEAFASAELEKTLRLQLAGWPADVVEQKVASIVADLEKTHAALAGGRRVFDVAAPSGALDAAALERLGTAVRSFGQCADCTCEKQGSCNSVMALEREVESETGLAFSGFVLGYLEAFPDTRLLSDRNDQLVDRLLELGSPAPVQPRSTAATTDAARKFEAMAEEVRGWARDPDVMRRAAGTNPRLARVLDGCFAGAENDEVLRAFAIVYEDYRAFRMAGSLIFKLMKKLVGSPAPVVEAAPVVDEVLVLEEAPAPVVEEAVPISAYALDDIFHPRESRRSRSYDFGPEALAMPLMTGGAIITTAPPAFSGRVGRVLSRLRPGRS